MSNCQPGFMENPWICPVAVTRGFARICEHNCVTVRAFQRRYREDGDEGALTIMFHCWNCNLMKTGDGWHCPKHHLDICTDCAGWIGRQYTPRDFGSKVQQDERRQYQPPLPFDKADKQDYYRPQPGSGPSTTPGSAAPKRRPLSRGEAPVPAGASAPPGKGISRGAARDRAGSERPRGSAGLVPVRPRSRERMGSTPRPGSDRKSQSWGAPKRHHLKDDEGVEWKTDLYPTSSDIRMWGWFERLNPSNQKELGRLLRKGRGDKQDYTIKDWVSAMGFLMTLLLRHGTRVSWAREPDSVIRDAPALEFDGQLWMKVSKVVEQPSFRQMNVCERDVIEFAKANAHAVETRFAHQIQDRISWVRAVQGHSLKLERMFSVDFFPGVPFAPGEPCFVSTLYHGTNAHRA